MPNFLKLDESCIVDKTIDVAKFSLKSNHEALEEIKQIKWVASLRPNETGLTPFEDDLRLYEEIQILELELLSTTHIFDVARIIMSAVKYPVILLLKYKNKYRVLMSKLYKNRADCDKYRIKGMVMTFWLFPEERELFPVTQKVLNALDITQYKEMNLYEAHQRIYNEICNFKCKAMSRAKTRRLVEFLIGKQGNKVCDSIFADCDIFEFHPALNAQNRFVKKRSTNYILAHDWEDVWRALLKYETTQKSISVRRYTSMEELMYRYDEYMERQRLC